MKKADIGLIGLAVMGENLVMNMESKGFTVAVFNRTTEKVDKFVTGRAAGKNIIGCHSLEELVDNLEKPRNVFMMVKVGNAVDDMIEGFCRCWKTAISSSTAAIRTSQTRFAEQNMSNPRASSTSAPASPAAKRGHSKDRA